MTAVNIVVSPEGAWGMMATDTAAYDDSGVVYAFESKVLTFPHKGAVVAVRGASENLTYIRAVVETFPTFDLFLACAPLVLLGTYSEHVEKTGCKRGLDLYVMGYSESEQRIVAAMANDKIDFAFVRGSIILAPNLSADKLAMAGIEASANGLAIGHPERDMLAILQAQRKLAVAEPGHAIGGQAVLTVMNRKRITQTVLHVWPDAIG